MIGGHTFTHIRAATHFTCALDSTGKAWCWGWDQAGKLGDGDAVIADANQPRAVAGGHTFATHY